MICVSDNNEMIVPLQNDCIVINNIVESINFFVEESIKIYEIIDPIGFVLDSQ